MKRARGSLAAGFALLEALISVGILAFGLVAIARLQASLMSNSDLAKQRSEAVQLGEQKLEDLRAYAALATYQGMVTTSDTITGTSASYTRSWAITNSAITALGGTTPVYKDVVMTVGWTSRGNTNESVTLRSIVAMYDPITSGLASVPPAGTPTRKPKNRDVGVPWGAVKLGNSRSALHPAGSPSGFAVMFNDSNGQVTATCTSATLPTSDNLTNSPTDTTTWGCTAFSGWLLAGYIGLPNNTPPINFHLTLAPTANTALSGTATLFGCWDDIGPSGTGTQLYTNYVTYACLLNTAASNGAWSGRATFSGQTFATPPATVTWGTENNRWFVCRYVVAGGEPYPYADVERSLLDQNYILRAGSNSNPSCPTGSVRSYP